MKRFFPLAALLVATCWCNLTGCTSRTATQAEPAPAVNVETLTSQTWGLASIAETPVNVISERSRPTLAFDRQQTRVSGMAGVNRFSGTYSLEGSSLKFGPLLATKMAGPPELNELETRYLRALEQTDRWRHERDNLVLLAGERVLARFTARP